MFEPLDFTDNVKKEEIEAKVDAVESEEEKLRVKVLIAKVTEHYPLLDPLVCIRMTPKMISSVSYIVSV